jgi:Protein of unknown function (DUF1595)
MRSAIWSVEVDELYNVFDESANEGMRFGESIAAALKVILTSPHFLYVMETLPDAASVDEAGDLCAWRHAWRFFHGTAFLMRSCLTGPTGAYTTGRTSAPAVADALPPDQPSPQPQTPGTAASAAAGRS